MAGFSDQKDYHGVRPWKCPNCKKTTTDFPALSRADNHTEICSACGRGDAFDDAAGELRLGDCRISSEAWQEWCRGGDDDVAR